MSNIKKDPNLLNGKGEWDESKHPRDSDGKFVKVSEFRRQSKRIDKHEHPIHVYAKNNEYAKGHSLTTTKKEHGITVEAIEMRENPNPQDKRKSYFLPKSKTVKLLDLTEQRKGWKLNKSDNKKMKKYRDFPFNNK